MQNKTVVGQNDGHDLKTIGPAIYQNEVLKTQ